MHIGTTPRHGCVRNKACKFACLEEVEHIGQVAAGNIAAEDSLEAVVASDSPVEVAAAAHMVHMVDSIPAGADIGPPALAAAAE